MKTKTVAVTQAVAAIGQWLPIGVLVGAALTPACAASASGAAAPTPAAQTAPAAPTALAAATSPADPPRFEALGDGQEVLDRKAKLVWRRCVEGMRWTGSTCWGFPERLDFAAAQARAAQQAKETGQKWRLPHLPELRLIMVKPEAPLIQSGPDRGKRAPWVDSQWFAGTPADWHWTASTSILGGNVNMYNYGNIMSGTTPSNVNRVSPRTGWALSFATGEPAGDVRKQNALVVRLVRPAP